MIRALFMFTARRWVFLVLTGLASCRSPSPQQIEEEPVRVTPTRVDFGRVWVGRDASARVSVTNPNRVTVALGLSIEGPFTLTTEPEKLAAGESLELEVHYAPSAEGASAGALTVQSQTVSLTGEGQQPPVCTASAACLVSTFDFERGACVEVAAPEDTDCTGSSGCFLRAVCSAGQCIGTATTCADGNPCTLDVCDAQGCSHLDDTLSCPSPESPCMVPTCSPDAGCGAEPVADGVECGPRTCSTASICLLGECVTRPAPQTQACADVIAGWAAGPGKADGPGPDARFSDVRSLVLAPDDTLFVAECAGVFCTSGALRSVAPSGLVRKLAHLGHVSSIVNVEPTGTVVVLEDRGNYSSLTRFRGASVKSLITNGLRQRTQLMYAPRLHAWRGVDSLGSVFVSQVGRVVLTTSLEEQFDRVTSADPLRACSRNARIGPDLREVELTSSPMEASRSLR